MHGARKLYGPQLRMVAGVKSLNVPVSIVDLDFTPELWGQGGVVVRV